MKQHILIASLLLSLSPLFSQIDYANIEINYGKSKVAFYDTTLIDHARSYSSLDQLAAQVPRPINVSIWHPVKEITGKRKLRVKNYLKVLQKEQEWPNLPFSYFFDWFNIPGTDTNKKNAEYEVKSVYDNQPVDSNNPVILYAASYQASSVENFILAEYFASHGYTFVAIPSKGADNLFLKSGTINDVYAQSRDIGFVIQNMASLGISNKRNIYLSGFSFGGISHILNAMNAPDTKGVISLDGTIKYRPELLEESFEYDVSEFDLPFIHFSQKDIPVQILKKEGTDTLINDKFEFYKKSNSPIKYQIKSKILTHDYFSSFGLLFVKRNEQQDYDYASILNAHKSLLVSSLAAVKRLEEYHLNNDWNHKKFIEALDTSIFSIVEYNYTSSSSVSIYDLLKMNTGTRYKELRQSYNHLIAKNQEVEVPEGKLNTIGLQLIFSPETYTEGVNIFNFALDLYPESANLYDSLAEGHLSHGEKELALLNFKKSLELDAGNTNAVKRIFEIEHK